MDVNPLSLLDSASEYKTKQHGKCGRTQFRMSLDIRIRVPERDGAGNEGRTAAAVLSQFGGAVAQALKTVETHCPSECVQASPLFSSAVDASATQGAPARRG